jgi:hypothetical protein
MCSEIVESKYYYTKTLKSIKKTSITNRARYDIAKLSMTSLLNIKSCGKVLQNLDSKPNLVLAIYSL